jgi:hypothetical protein
VLFQLTYLHAQLICPLVSEIATYAVAVALIVPYALQLDNALRIRGIGHSICKVIQSAISVRTSRADSR